MNEVHYFMKAIRRGVERSVFTLFLSMSVFPCLVNAQAPSSTPVKKSLSSDKSEFKDSVKEPKADIVHLISTVLKNGTRQNTGKNLAPVIGLPKAMSVMVIEVDIRKQADIKETRRCFVVYENDESASPEVGGKRAVCAYIVKIKHSGLNRQSRYFRLDLDGKLEKVVLSQGKFDETGKVVIGSGVKTDQDIDSPEVRKTFEAEMKFWLKDWLKKQQKLDAKKATAAAAKSGSVAKKGSATADSTP